MHLSRSCSPRSLPRVQHVLLTVAAVFAFALSINAQSQPEAQVLSPADIPSEVTVRGVVLTVTDHKPIPGALVDLSMHQRVTTADDQGRFEFTGVPLGENPVLSAKKDGFLCVLTHSGPLPDCVQSLDKAVEDQLLQAGDPKKAQELLKSKSINVTITLMPAATVVGRVVDTAGKPVSDMQVILTYRRIVDGHEKWNAQAGLVKTDAEGNYQINKLEPDTYILHTPITADPAWGKGCCDHGYPATWYPDASNADSAQRFAVAPGEHRTADLTLKRQEFQSVTVPWSWTRTEKVSGGGWDLSSPGIRDPLPGNWDSDRHLYHFFLPAGDYHLSFSIDGPTDASTGNRAPWSDGTKDAFMGSVNFTVADSPLTLPPVPIQQPIDIPIHVTAQLTNQEKRKAAPLSDYSYSPPQVYFHFPGDPGGFKPRMQWNTKEAKSDLAFKSVPPGSHIIEAYVPTGCYAYVASLTCGAANLFRDPLVVAPGIPRCTIEALVRDDLASLTIQLTPQALAGMKAAGVQNSDVALIPMDNPLEKTITAFAGLLDAEPLSIPPGRWLAVIFDGRALAWREPDVWQQLLRLGKVVSIAAGQSETIQLDRSPELNNPRVKTPGVGSELP
jgi:hypothetical protein